MFDDKFMEVIKLRFGDFCPVLTKGNLNNELSVTVMTDMKFIHSFPYSFIHLSFQSTNTY